MACSPQDTSARDNRADIVMRTREEERELGNKKNFIVKHRVSEIALDFILKLGRA